jgi:hypothetical protein
LGVTRRSGGACSNGHGGLGWFTINN